MFKPHSGGFPSVPPKQILYLVILINLGRACHMLGIKNQA